MSENPIKHTKVLIIGSGPAGYTAAVYAARAMLSPVLVYGSAPGGQLTTTTDVENYPGFSDVIQGPWLMDQMRDQAKAVGTDLIEDHISSVNLKSTPFEAIGDSGQKYTADSIIISTGAQARWLNLESEQKFRGFGVSACATCDGAFFRDEEVMVIGGGDSACEEATFLTRFASKVTLVHRRDVFRASTIMYERVAKHPKIEIKTFRQVKEFLSDEKGLTGAVLEDPRDGSTEEIAVTGAFIAIGHTPITEFLGGQVATDDEGYIVHHEHTMTNVPGVFAAGDVVDTRYKQAITAAGMGCQAAMDAEKWLEENVH
mgnify:CR=1 FL=1